MDDDVKIFVNVETRQTLELTPEECFPGGVPEVVDAAAVIASMKEAGSVRECLSEWDLGEDLEIHVQVNDGIRHDYGVWSDG